MSALTLSASVDPRALRFLDEHVAHDAGLLCLLRNDEALLNGLRDAVVEVDLHDEVVRIEQLSRLLRRLGADGRAQEDRSVVRSLKS